MSSIEMSSHVIGYVNDSREGTTFHHIKQYLESMGYSKIYLQLQIVLRTLRKRGEIEKKGIFYFPKRQEYAQQGREDAAAANAQCEEEDGLQQQLIRVEAEKRRMAEELQASIATNRELHAQIEEMRRKIQELEAQRMETVENQLALEDEDFNQQIAEWEEQFQNWTRLNVNYRNQDAYFKYIEDWKKWKEEEILKREKAKAERAAVNRHVMIDPCDVVHHCVDVYL